MIKPLCSNFRVITAIFSRFRVSRIFTVSSKRMEHFHLPSVSAEWLYWWLADGTFPFVTCLCWVIVLMAGGWNVSVCHPSLLSDCTDGWRMERFRLSPVSAEWLYWWLADGKFPSVTCLCWVIVLIAGGWNVFVCHLSLLSDCTDVLIAGGWNVYICHLSLLSDCTDVLIAGGWNVSICHLSLLSDCTDVLIAGGWNVSICHLSLLSDCTDVLIAGGWNVSICHLSLLSDCTDVLVHVTGGLNVSICHLSLLSDCTDVLIAGGWNVSICHLSLLSDCTDVLIAGGWNVSICHLSLLSSCTDVLIAGGRNVSICHLSLLSDCTDVLIAGGCNVSICHLSLLSDCTDVLIAGGWNVSICHLSLLSDCTDVLIAGGWNVSICHLSLLSDCTDVLIAGGWKVSICHLSLLSDCTDVLIAGGWNVSICHLSLLSDCTDGWRMERFRLSPVSAEWLYWWLADGTFSSVTCLCWVIVLMAGGWNVSICHLSLLSDSTDGWQMDRFHLSPVSAEWLYWWLAGGTFPSVTCLCWVIVLMAGRWNISICHLSLLSDRTDGWQMERFHLAEWLYWWLADGTFPSVTWFCWVIVLMTGRWNVSICHLSLLSDCTNGWQMERFHMSPVSAEWLYWWLADGTFPYVTCLCWVIVLMAGRWNVSICHLSLLSDCTDVLIGGGWNVFVCHMSLLSDCTDGWRMERFHLSPVSAEWLYWWLADGMFPSVTCLCWVIVLMAGGWNISICHLSLLSDCTDVLIAGGWNVFVCHMSLLSDCTDGWRMERFHLSPVSAEWLYWWLADGTFPSVTCLCWVIVLMAGGWNVSICHMSLQSDCTDGWRMERLHLSPVSAEWLYWCTDSWRMECFRLSPVSAEWLYWWLADGTFPFVACLCWVIVLMAGGWNVSICNLSLLSDCNDVLIAGGWNVSICHLSLLSDCTDVLIVGGWNVSICHLSLLSDCTDVLIAGGLNVSICHLPLMSDCTDVLIAGGWNVSICHLSLLSDCTDVLIAGGWNVSICHLSLLSDCTDVLIAGVWNVTICHLSLLSDCTDGWRMERFRLSPLSAEWLYWWLVEGTFPSVTCLCWVIVLMAGRWNVFICHLSLLSDCTDGWQMERFHLSPVFAEWMYWWLADGTFPSVTCLCWVIVLMAGRWNIFICHLSLLSDCTDGWQMERFHMLPVSAEWLYWCTDSWRMERFRLSHVSAEWLYWWLADGTFPSVTCLCWVIVLMAGGWNVSVCHLSLLSDCTDGWRMEHFHLSSVSAEWLYCCTDSWRMERFHLSPVSAEWLYWWLADGTFPSVTCLCWVIVPMAGGWNVSICHMSLLSDCTDGCRMERLHLLPVSAEWLYWCTDSWRMECLSLSPVSVVWLYWWLADGTFPSVTCLCWVFVLMAGGWKVSIGHLSLLMAGGWNGSICHLSLLNDCTDG